MSKTPKSLVGRIQDSEKMQPWCKRFFLFMLSQGVECRKSDLQRWNKAVITQKQRNERSKTAAATCSFVAAAKRQLPQLQGVAEKVLSTLNTTLKKYGAIMWFIVRENKMFVIFNVFTLKQAAKLLKDVESRQVQSDVLKALGSDLSRANARFKGIDSLVVTFCPSDISEIQNKVSEAAESVQQPIIESDEKVSPQPEEAYIGKIAPFARNQPVEVFSKTSEQWVPANVVCVQEDIEGIFVTVKRIDGHELDYDIDNVRAVRLAPTHSGLSQSKDDAIREQIMLDTHNVSAQRDDFATRNESAAEYSEQEHVPERTAGELPQQFKPQSQPIPSNFVISDAEWFKRMETFHIFDKIRSVKTWLHGMIEKNEPLPRIIAEELQEVYEIL